MKTGVIPAVVSRNPCESTSYMGPRLREDDVFPFNLCFAGSLRNDRII